MRDLLMGVRIVLTAVLPLRCPYCRSPGRQGYHTGCCAVLCSRMAVAVWLARRRGGLAHARPAMVGRRRRAHGRRRRRVHRRRDGFVLDGLHALTLVGYAAAAAAAGAALAIRLRAPVEAAGAPAGRIAPVTAASGARLGGCVAFALGFAATHAPLTLYDAPAITSTSPRAGCRITRCRSCRRRSATRRRPTRRPTASSLFLWLMAPWHGDFLARVRPGAVLAPRRRRALRDWRVGSARRAAHAWYPAAFFLLARPVVEQAVGADVDLILRRALRRRRSIWGSSRSTAIRRRTGRCWAWRSA